MRTLISRLTLILTLALFSAGIPARASHAAMDIQTVTSPTYGIKAWLVEDHSVPLIALNFAFKDAGTAQDSPDKQGLVRLMSNTMDEGAGNLNAQDFQKALDDNSISLFYSADRDDFKGALKTLTRKKDTAFDLLRQSLNAPRFDAEAVQRMALANQSRIRQSMTQPDWIAARLTNAAAFAGHPYAQNSGGTLSTLSAITPDDLKTYHARALARDNLRVAVAGDITADALGKALDEIFAALPAQSDLTPIPYFTLENMGQTWLYKSDIPQTIIAITQPGMSIQSPDYHYAQLMNFILGASGFGSRLMHSVREEKGLTYGIYTSLTHYAHIDTLNLQTSTKNQSAAEVLALIKSEWQAMRTQPITQQELDDAKSYLIGSLPLGLTSTDKIADLLLYLQSNDLPPTYLQQREDTIKAATLEQVEAVAKTLLNPEDFITILVGAPDAVQVDKQVKDLPDVQ
jgi:zinc protease